MADIIINNSTEEETWKQVKTHLANNNLSDSILIKDNLHSILLIIDIDLGGGFEGGFSTTQLKSAIKMNNDFRFAIHKKNILDDVGKFFGMQDVIIGYKEFDDAFIIKTTDEKRVKEIFADKETRETLKSISHFTLSMEENNSEEKLLEMYIEEGITDTVLLKKIYQAFYSVLLQIEEQEADY
jgi:hypothetical protein